MTKKILFIISGLLVLGAIIAVIVTNKPRTSDKIITISSENNFVYTESKRISFKVYSNKLKHKMHFANNISHVYLVASDESQRFELELVNISYSHSEKYLKDDYYCYVYSFMMPRLEANLLVEDAHLEITLVNSIKYLLPVGEFKFLYYQEVGLEPVISINGLYGYKQQNSEYARLAKIIIEYEKKTDFKLEQVSIDGSNNLQFIIENNQIEIEIPYRQLSLSQAPIILTFSAEGKSVVQVVDNFQFFSDYQILSTSGDLINVVATD